MAKTTDLNAPASRELVAELLFQGIQKAQVTYTPAFGYVTDKVIGTASSTIGVKNFKLDSSDTADKWGRPATKWTYTTGDKSTTYVDKPDVSYTKAVAECDVAHDLGLKADTSYTLYVNGKVQSAKYIVNLTDTVTKMGAQGRLTEVYGDTIVMIDTFLAKVTSVSDAAYDSQGHLRTAATIKLDVYDGARTQQNLTLTNGEDNYAYAKGDYVLVNAWTNATNGAKESGTVIVNGVEGTDYYGEIVGKAESFDGAQTIIYWNAKQHNVAGTVYDDAMKFILNEAGNTTENHTWFLDQYGNLIGAIDIEAATSYGVINSIWWVGNATDGSGVAKANVTYMDGTTGQIEISEMTYNTGNVGAAYVAATGEVTHSTGNNAKVMRVATVGRDSYFYVDTYASDNALADKTKLNDQTPANLILNGHLFQFTTKANGTAKAVEVSGNGATGDYSKFHDVETRIYKSSQYGNGLVVNDNTVFLVRSGEGTTAKPYTFKSVTGFANIENYAENEVDYVDLNGDNVADYVYIIAEPSASKVTSVFYYDGEQAEYDATTKLWTIPGYIDGKKDVVYSENGADDFKAALESQTDSTLYRVALSDKVVDYFNALATIGEDKAGTVAQYSNDYPLADVYTGWTEVKFSANIGTPDDKFDGNVYTIKYSGTEYRYSITAADSQIVGKFGDVTDQNTIVVYNNAAGEGYRTVLSIYIADKNDVGTSTVITAVNVDALKPVKNTTRTTKATVSAASSASGMITPVPVTATVTWAKLDDDGYYQPWSGASFVPGNYQATVTLSTTSARYQLADNVSVAWMTSALEHVDFTGTEFVVSNIVVE